MKVPDVEILRSRYKNGENHDAVSWQISKSMRSV